MQDLDENKLARCAAVTALTDFSGAVGEHPVGGGNGGWRSPTGMT